MGVDTFDVRYIAVLFTFSSLAILAVCLRIWSQKLGKQNLWWHDYLAIAGLIFGLAQTYFIIYVLFFVMARDSTGFPTRKAMHEIITLEEKAVLIDPILWSITLTFIRSSAISLYLRLFGTISHFPLLCYLVISVNVMFAIATTLATCLDCRPIAYRWNHSLSGHCGRQQTQALSTGIVNLILDITTVIMPMPIVWKLQMVVKKKLMVCGIFSFGIGICTLTLYRLYYSLTVKLGNWQHDQKSHAFIVVLTCTESLLGVINVCLPSLKHLLKHFGNIFPRKKNLNIQASSAHNVPYPTRTRSDESQTPMRYVTLKGESSYNSYPQSSDSKPDQELTSRDRTRIDDHSTFVAKRYHGSQDLEFEGDGKYGKYCTSGITGKNLASNNGSTNRFEQSGK